MVYPIKVLQKEEDGKNESFMLEDIVSNFNPFSRKELSLKTIK
jgi:hypothetical protein